MSAWFWAIFDKNAQTWHDKIARTVVLAPSQRVPGSVRVFTACVGLAMVAGCLVYTMPGVFSAFYPILPQAKTVYTPPPPSPPPPSPPPPSLPTLVGGPVRPVVEHIPLIKEGGVYKLPVELNGIITRLFVLDTGATDVNIPDDVEQTLYRAGTIRDTDFLPDRIYRQGDGSTVKSPRRVLRSIKMG